MTRTPISDPIITGYETLQWSRSHDICLVRSTARGTPGDTLCGRDRFVKDGPGWSVGGGFTDPAARPCPGCDDAREALPVGGMFRPLFEAKLVRTPLVIRPVDITEAKAFVRAVHRHHPKSPAGAKFAIGLDRDEVLVGIVMVGRPSRMEDNGWRAEVTRVAVIEGVPNGCSMLYAAAWRACRAMGYRELRTRTLDTEPGTSLIAAGWHVIGRSKGRSWSRPSRPRDDTAYSLTDKLVWAIGA